MQFKKLGNSGLITSDLALGTMLFGENAARSTLKEVAIQQIHHYLDQGGNHIDTANVYADGRSEEILGEALKGIRQEIILATKVRFPRGKGPNKTGLSRGHIIQEVEASLNRLQTDYLDLYYMHCWDPLTPIEESLLAFEDLVRAGKVRYIGVSNFKAWQVMKSLGISDQKGISRFIAAQYQYSLVKRDIEYEFPDLCASEGIGITAWGPLGGGFLSGKYRADQKPRGSEAGRIGTTPSVAEESWDRRNTAKNWETLQVVQEIAESKRANPAQIAISWLRHQPLVSSVILGARTLPQLEDNLKAAQIQLSLDELKRLSDVSQPDELYPYRMIEAYGNRSLQTEI
ncbi:MAG: aldo/keto reductase [Bacteroidota bacterium]